MLRQLSTEQAKCQRRTKQPDADWPKVSIQHLFARLRYPTRREVCPSTHTLAVTNKYLAQSNKSRTDCEATKKRFRRQWCSRKAMTLQQAKSIARHLGLTLRKVRSGDYRVNFRDGNETTAYYTDNLEDAVNTAIEMARKRASVVTKECPNCGHSPC